MLRIYRCVSITVTVSLNIEHAIASLSPTKSVFRVSVVDTAYEKDMRGTKRSLLVVRVLRADNPVLRMRIIILARSVIEVE